MLDKFTVKGFKSLVDVTVDLGVVNVFVGANGSGKSNLLEAVGILGAAAFGAVGDESRHYRGIRLSSNTNYHAKFEGMSQIEAMVFEGTNSSTSYSASYRYAS